MPTPADLLSQKLDDPSDPDDQLRLMMGQDQGANLAGGPDATPDAQTPPSQGGVGGPPPPAGMPQPMAPSPNVPGPLSALPKAFKPHIRLKSRGPAPKPHIKLKSKTRIKPKIKLKASANV